MDPTKIAGITVGLFIVAAGAVVGYRNRARFCPTAWIGWIGNRRHSFSSMNRRPAIDRPLENVVVEPASVPNNEPASVPNNEPASVPNNEPASVPTITVPKPSIPISSPPRPRILPVFFTSQSFGPRHVAVSAPAAKSGRMPVDDLVVRPSANRSIPAARSCPQLITIGRKTASIIPSDDKQSTIDKQPVIQTVDYGATGHNITPFRPPPPPPPPPTIDRPISTTAAADDNDDRTKRNTASDGTALVAVAAVGAIVLTAAPLVLSSASSSSAEPSTVGSPPTGISPGGSRWTSARLLPEDQDRRPHRWPRRDVDALPPVVDTSS